MQRLAGSLIRRNPGNGLAAQRFDGFHLSAKECSCSASQFSTLPPLRMNCSNRRCCELKEKRRGPLRSNIVATGGLDDARKHATVTVHSLTANLPGMLRADILVVAIARRVGALRLDQLVSVVIDAA